MEQSRKIQLGSAAAVWDAICMRRHGLLLLMWCVAVFVFSSIPGNKYPKVQWEYADKSVHVALYAIGGFLAAMWYNGRNKSYYLGFVFAAIYGVSDEVHQLFVPRRTFSYYDLLADGIGAALGAALFGLASAYSPQVVKKLLHPHNLQDNTERMTTT